MRCCPKTVSLLLSTASVLALCAGTLPVRAGVSAIAGEEAPNVERRVTDGNRCPRSVEWYEKDDGMDFYHIDGAITGLRLVCSGL